MTEPSTDPALLERLDYLNLTADPAADQVVAGLVAGGRISEVNALLRDFHGNDQIVPAQLPAEIAEFLSVSARLPTWADPARLDRVRGFFTDDGIHVAAVLSLSSMLQCYALPDAAELLGTTQRLEYPRRRMTQTGQFVLRMMDENAFGPDGGFVPAAQKVRLIHAAIRRHLREEGWDERTLGVPMSQRSMLVALMIFSVGVIEGLEILEISVTDVEAADYYHAWRVAGHLLGIQDEVMPEDLDEARKLFAAVKTGCFGPSEVGVLLTRELLDLYVDIVPSRVFGPLVPALARLLVGDQIADWMGVPRSRWDRVARALPRWIGRLERSEDRWRPAAWFLDRTGRLVLDLEYKILAHGVEIGLDIPEQLRGR
jgi:hypothetical protein